MPETHETDTVEAIQQAAEDIANQLQEQHPPARLQIRRIVAHLGVATAYDFLHQTLEAEAQGGLLTHDKSQRRTPGGAFFFIVRGQVSPEVRRILWPQERYKKPAPPGQQPILPWEDRERLAAPALAEKGAATTVKITLVGRPARVIERPDAVILTMTGPKPPALPKGLPVLPETAVTVFLVYVARKQWQKVAPSLQNREDKLIIEGYPFLDAKLNVIGVLTQSATTVLLQRINRPTPPPT